MKNQYLFLVILSAVFLFTQCTEDESTDLQSGILKLKITDAASDDENIKGIFITVAEIKLDGKPIRNFSPQTIEISKLKNGQTRLLLEKELAARPHEQISLVLSAGTDNPINTSGCYVLTRNNSTHNLFTDNNTSGTLEVSASKTFELLPEKEYSMIIDFNLRKAIVRKTTGKSSYSFVTPTELEKAIRLINEKTSGAISGKVIAKEMEDTHMYVYAYRKGEFSASTEGNGSGKSKVLFSNSVTGTRVESDGSYFLPFMEEGEYDIRLASFKKNKNNIYTFNGFLLTTSKRTHTPLNGIYVSSGSEIEIDIEVFSMF